MRNFARDIRALDVAVSGNRLICDRHGTPASASPVKTMQYRLLTTSGRLKLEEPEDPGQD